MIYLLDILSLKLRVLGKHSDKVGCQSTYTNTSNERPVKFDKKDHECYN